MISFEKKVAKDLESIYQVFTEEEVLKRFKVISALLSISAVKKFVYLRVAMLNDRQSNRVVNGFLKTREEIQDMFSRRYS